jgi:hypothetical protein
MLQAGDRSVTESTGALFTHAQGDRGSGGGWATIDQHLNIQLNLFMG